MIQLSQLLSTWRVHIFAFVLLRNWIWQFPEQSDLVARVFAACISQIIEPFFRPRKNTHTNLFIGKKMLSSWVQLRLNFQPIEQQSNQVATNLICKLHVRNSFIQTHFIAKSSANKGSSQSEHPKANLMCFFFLPEKRVYKYRRNHFRLFCLKNLASKRVMSAAASSYLARKQRKRPNSLLYPKNQSILYVLLLLLVLFYRKQQLFYSKLNVNVAYKVEWVSKFVL